MSSRVAFGLGLGSLLVAMLTANDAFAFCRMTTEGSAPVGNAPCDEKGEPLEWSYSCLSYAIDHRGTKWTDWMSFDDVETAVDTSFQTWQNVTCEGEPVNLIFRPQQSSTCRKAEYLESGGNVNTIAFLDPWEDQSGRPYDSNAFAVTVVWHDTSTGEIFDADMLINDTLGPYDNCPNSGCQPGGSGSRGPADLRSIVTHEAGHFIGIGHSDDPETTMFPSVERTEVSKRILAADDEAAACFIYPPGSLEDTCQPEVKGGLDLNCEDAPPSSSSGGCAARRIAAGETDGSALLLALLVLTVLRRRSARRDARS